MEELKDRPAGRLGETVHEVAGEPPLEGSMGVIAVPVTKFAELGE